MISQLSVLSRMAFSSLFPQLRHRANHWMSQIGNRRPSFQTTTLVFYSLLSCLQDWEHSQLTPKALLDEALPLWQTLLSSQPWLHSHLFQIERYAPLTCWGAGAHTLPRFCLQHNSVFKGLREKLSPQIQQLAKLFFNVKEHLTDSQINKNWDS